MTKVILVRHGQTIWNLELKYQGHTDIELTELGIRQAQLVADRLASENVAAVFASDLSRAYKTAEFIAAKHGLSVVTVPELREIRFGAWEGLTYDGINSQWPDIMKKLYTSPDDVVIPGGETFRELKARAEGAIKRIVSEHPNQTIVVVSHGGTIRTLLCAALNIHLNYVWNIRQDNTAVNIIEYYRERAVVALVNDVHHLKGL
ncbi:alpha-ribazole phosphatase [Sporolituus thermophilus]|uniref:Alpha-ribazole phosphatase n=1 Tax=Sporolituus thermophilus DSM 23256 TaxID=1123285 RepID=A0A1G7I515_9FIRM|nr:alpha-ribazole phosphatase [Sporolituus thermophilus]SDF07524.1 alpha-ribazole phosphatase [Sporolituus thermophilus DSM 23256]